jgi:hypothetical protein
VRKAWVRSNENVGESEQVREFVVEQNLAGEILEENPFLFLMAPVRKTRAHALGHGLDRRRFSGCNASLEVDKDEQSFVPYPFLELAEFDLKLASYSFRLSLAFSGVI